MGTISRKYFLRADTRPETETLNTTHTKSTCSNAFVNFLPKWFIGITGILYTTGFLVVSWHLGRMGIKEAGSDIFKLKFIEIGILYMLPYTLIVFPTVLLFKLWRIRRQLLSNSNFSERILKRKWRDLNIRTACALVSFILYFLYFIIFLYFSPHDYIKKHVTEVIEICILPISYIAIARGLPKIYDKWLLHKAKINNGDLSTFNREQFFIEKHTTKQYFYISVTSRIIPTLAVIITSVLIIVSNNQLRSAIYNSLTNNGSFLYITFTTFSMLIAIYVIKRFESNSVVDGIKVIYLGFSSIVIGTFFYYNIIAFSSNIYPLIPAYKGGGDYSQMADTIIYFRENYSIGAHPPVIPKQILAAKSKTVSKRLKIVYDTQFAIYATEINYLARQEGELPQPSTIYCLRRENIASMEFSWGSPNFRLSDFDKTSFIKFCDRLNARTTGTSVHNILQLNTLLEDCSLYNRFKRINSQAIGGKEFKVLFTAFQPYMFRKFKTLRTDEQRIVLCFNRALIESLFVGCPKSDFLNEVLNESPYSPQLKC
ncbi:MAG: hypothetical protein KKA55_02115 [Proteobacteria bacterium]|nr:hypothetical protein [Pseudomonadota bacterium]MBU1594315.1 hypothetical protein [Pseudomonadota bacterium]